jgi:transcriptional regulator with XRE-family HTH domain
MDKNGFGKWLREELRVRGMTQSDLARQTVRTGGDVSTAEISRIIRGERGFESKTAVELAVALNLPPQVVFVAAGLMPPEPDLNVAIREMERIALQLPLEKQMEALEFLRLQLRLAEQRVRNEKVARDGEAAGAT